MNIERYSSKLKLLTVTMLTLRFVFFLKAVNRIRGDNELGDISASELKLAEDLVEAGSTRLPKNLISVSFLCVSK